MLLSNKLQILYTEKYEIIVVGDDFLRFLIGIERELEVAHTKRLSFIPLISKIMCKFAG